MKPKFAFGIIAAAALAAACTIMEPPAVISAEGKIYVDDAILDLSYEIGSVYMYSRDGRLLASVVPKLVYKPNAATPGGISIIDPDLDYISWKIDAAARPGIGVKFWVEFRDIINDVVYYGQAQEDILTPGNVYRWTIESLYVPIHNEAELKLIGKHQRFPAEKNYVLVSAVTLSEPWLPLCGESTPFSGAFDGNDNTIRGLHFETSKMQYIGLFAYLKGTAAKPVAIKNLNIELAPHDIPLGTNYSQHFGLLAGCAEFVNIERVSVRMKNAGSSAPLALVKQTGSQLSFGGIVGTLRGTSSLTRCSVWTPLSAAMDAANCSIYGGALAGLIDASAQNAAVTVKQCYAPFDISISVTSPQPPANAVVFAGGLIGGGKAGAACAVTIDESFFAGNMSLENATNCDAGSLFGRGATTLTLNKVVGLTNRIEYSTNGAAANNFVNRLAGQTATHTFDYAATPFTLTSANPLATTAGDSISRTRIDALWFSDQPAYGGIGWDFNSTWFWSGIWKLPVFQWE